MHLFNLKDEFLCPSAQSNRIFYTFTGIQRLPAANQSKISLLLPSLRLSQDDRGAPKKAFTTEVTTPEETKPHSLQPGWGLLVNHTCPEISESVLFLPKDPLENPLLWRNPVHNPVSWLHKTSSRAPQGLTNTFRYGVGWWCW